jgi:pyruvate,orthophosphate dikinase
MNIQKMHRVNNSPHWKRLMPKLYKELDDYQKKLEDHYKDMQDIEFTIEKENSICFNVVLEKKWNCCCTHGTNACRKLIDGKTAIMRVGPNQLVELLLQCLIPKLNKQIQ